MTQQIVRSLLRALVASAFLLLPAVVLWLTAGSAEAAGREEPLPAVVGQIGEVGEVADTAAAPVRRVVQHDVRPHVERAVTTTNDLVRSTPVGHVTTRVVDRLVSPAVPEALRPPAAGPARSAVPRAAATTHHVAARPHHHPTTTERSHPSPPTAVALPGPSGASAPPSRTTQERPATPVEAPCVPALPAPAGGQSAPAGSLTTLLQPGHAADAPCSSSVVGAFVPDGPSLVPGSRPD